MDYNKNMQNTKIITDLFNTVMRTMDYVTTKNNDQSLFGKITSESGNREENIELLKEIVASIISKQLREKFSL